MIQSPQFGVVAVHGVAGPVGVTPARPAGGLVGVRQPRQHLRPEGGSEGVQMNTRRVVETTLGDEVVQNVGLLGAQPVVGVRAQDAVLPMGVRRAGRGGRNGRRVGHGGHRTAGALLAVLGLIVASLLSGLGASSPAAAKDKVVFHVGMLGEGVDSLNPFLGFQAPSYEMWGLTYDYLTGYTMK